MTKPKKRENVTRIYGLVDPRDGRVRYVGKTTRNLRERLWQHINIRNAPDAKTAWIIGLLMLNLEPTIVELDAMRTCERDSDKEEEFWVRVHRSEGSPLLNATEGGTEGKRVRVFTPEEKAALRRGIVVE